MHKAQIEEELQADVEMVDSTKNACLTGSAELKNDLAGLQVRKELKIAQQEQHNKNGVLACQALCHAKNLSTFTPRQLSHGLCAGKVPQHLQQEAHHESLQFGKDYIF